MIEDPLPFEAAAFEIQDQADRMAGDLEVVEHLTYFVIGDAFDDLGVDHHEIEDDEIGNIFADLHCFVNDVVTRLLVPRNPTQPEFDTQGIFIGLLQQPMTQSVDNLKCAADDLTRLDLISQSVFIRVQPWLKIRT